MRLIAAVAVLGAVPWAVAHTVWRACKRTAGGWIGLTVALAVWGVHPPPVHAQTQLYVQVFDQRTGRIVTDLRKTEVMVRKDGLSYPVLDVRAANLPVKLTVLVDNGAAASRAFGRIQDGLRSFFGRLRANQSMSVLTLSPRPRWVFRGVYDRDEIRDGVGRTAVEGDSPTPLLDGVVEATEWLAAESQLHRPVVVIVSADGADVSADLATKFDRLMERVRRNGITMHSLVMSTPRPASFEHRISVPEALGRDLSAATGGSYTSILLGSSLDQPLADIAERIRSRSRELATQYLVRYERPEGDDPGGVQVGILRLGARYSVTVDGRLP